MDVSISITMWCGYVPRDVRWDVSIMHKIARTKHEQLQMLVKCEIYIFRNKTFDSHNTIGTCFSMGVIYSNRKFKSQKW